MQNEFFSFFLNQSRMPICHVVSFSSSCTAYAKISKVSSWRELYRLRKFLGDAATMNIKVRVSHQRVKERNKSRHRPLKAASART